MTGPGHFLNVAGIGTNIKVQHEKWIETPGKSRHGNDNHDYEEPVERDIISWWPLNWETNLPDVVSADYEARLVHNVEMAVADASVYSKNDRVTLQDLPYIVQQQPYDWQGGPLPGYNRFACGTVHLRRVT